MVSRFASSFLVLGVVALLGHATAGRVGGAPAPGHQEILDSINTWSRTLPAAERFVSVMSGAATLDKETGLVWETAPDSESSTLDRKSWAAARVFCNQRTVGNRKGWRLPTVQELASLVDPSVSPGPTLPVGHPFSNVQSYAYWTATVLGDDPTAAWYVNFQDGTIFVVNKTFDQNFVWCVRGGHAGTDTQ